MREGGQLPAKKFMRLHVPLAYSPPSNSSQNLRGCVQHSNCKLRVLLHVLCPFRVVSDSHTNKGILLKHINWNGGCNHDCLRKIITSKLLT
jgi:hypothetical protein